MLKPNAFGELTNRARIKMKPNIKGKITMENRNYTREHLEQLEPLFRIEDPELMYVKQNRNPEVEPPNRLPTADLPFYPIDEHNAIGTMESKQNIYLNIAYFCNKLMEKVESLELRVKELESQNNGKIK